MARKRTYKALEVNDCTQAMLQDQLQDAERVVVGLDLAKKKQFACFMTPQRQILAIVTFESPTDNADFVRLLAELPVSVELALESTGTYGEALRYALDAAGVPVFQVATKRAHDAAELYDGVPSIHDAKASAVLAWAHLQGYSSPWPPSDEATRRMRAVAQRAKRADHNFQRAINQLEAMLAIFWPELSAAMELTSATLLGLLSQFGGPRAVAAQPQAAAELMRKIGGHFLQQDTIASVLDSAAHGVGVPMIDEEIESLRELASEAERLRQLRRQSRRQLEALSEDLEVVRVLRPVLGPYTALILVLLAGDPRQFDSAAAYTKALGLNLAEHSSGQKRGGLHISRRGSSYARNLLYLAALRLIQSDALTRAWYEKRLQSNGGIKLKAIVAVMRKLTRAVWQLGRSGAVFDSRRLFTSVGPAGYAEDERRAAAAASAMEAAMN